jgi:phosphomevalonate kinase
MTRLVAISGKRFSGKDTLAGMIVDEAARRGVTVPVWAFAAESKRMFAAGRPEVDGERLLRDRAYKETWRPELTKFTVESIAADPLVFCRGVCGRIDAAGVPAVISDLRLRLELDWLRPRYALRVVRVVRSDARRAESGWTRVDSVDGHHTETELDDPSLWDVVVPNDGSLDELRARAREVCDQQLSAA